MTVSTLLCRKPVRIITIPHDAAASAAAKLLRAEGIGPLVNKDLCGTKGDAVLGIVSERDILAALVRQGATAMMPVAAMMTPGATGPAKP